MLKTKYLIIGNGIASLSAAREIRKNDEEASVSIVSSEDMLTYYRMKLTDYIAKDFEDEDLLATNEDWYKDNNIDLYLNRDVEEIYVEKNKIVLDDKREIQYEKLLLATGSKPFVPPITGTSKEGVFALRTLEDLKNIKDYLQDVKNVTVVGGGLLGIEAAWSLKKLGKEVNIIQSSSHLLSRQLDEEVSKKLERELEREGFNLILNSRTKEILGGEKIEGIRLNEERDLETDVVLLSTGVRSNLDLVKETDIKHDRGIIVDKHLRTNIDNIYAAGDVIQFNKMTLGLWTVSNAEGKIAGANMTGDNQEYTNPNIFTNLRIGNIKLFSAGIIDDFDEAYEYKEEDIHNKIFVKEGKIVGSILFGDLSKMNIIRKAVVSNENIKEFLKEDKSFSKLN